MGADPRLPKMPEKPTLHRLLQASLRLDQPPLRRARPTRSRPAWDEKVVLACLLHDIGVVSFIRCDHGYWGAQLIEPYVDEEVSWSVRVHQVLRGSFPTSPWVTGYPDLYVKFFGRRLQAGTAYRGGVPARPQP